MRPAIRPAIRLVVRPAVPAMALEMRPAIRLVVRPAVLYLNQTYKQKFINNVDAKLQAPQYAKW